MKMKRNHWYVIGWSDAVPCVALCLEPRSRKCYFPNSDGRGNRPVDYADGPEQVLKDLGSINPPAVPKPVRDVRLD